MSDDLTSMLNLQFWHDNGFVRNICTKCENPFWTLDAQREDCGDSTCTEYSFLGKPLSKSPLSVSEMRKAFQEFWSKRGHTPVPRNPVVARWRDDLYLNIASIANYQPHITSGEVEPPANPLVVSQPCIRLNDLSNIGRSGRHFSCFEMMGHHTFNSAAWGEHYWTEECVEGGHTFLTDVLGLEPKSLTYVESTWNGGGNAGPCLEVFAGGLEVATLVFMCLEEDENGEYQIKNERYRMMDLRIIDTGWGLERLAWASQGTPTAYDTVFPELLDRIRSVAKTPIAQDDRARMLVQEHARVQGLLNLDVGQSLDGLRAEVVSQLQARGVETTQEELATVMGPVENMYVLADHLRCLSFMVGDGVVPGNVKAGYLMRLVFRRAFRAAQELQIEEPLADLLVWNMRNMLQDFPEFEEALGRAHEMAVLELERYQESRDRGTRLVERMLKQKDTLSVEDLLDLYDSHGVGPNLVQEAAKSLGKTVDVPDTFDALVAERHGSNKKAKAKVLDFGVPATKLLFYEDQDCEVTDAKVLWAGSVQDKPAVVLDQTNCFWETGGQPGDRGTMVSCGKTWQITGMRKEGDHAVHFLDGDGLPDVGSNVMIKVDWELRMDHTRSHTATHIVNQSVRRVLGNHSWQAGTQKYQDCARVDMTHFRRPTEGEVQSIERLANQIVMEGRKVTRAWWKRGEAEATYGMQLLQGGIPKGEQVRVVTIHGKQEGDEPFDVEYCGGTHCHTTHEVGPVKIWRTERIQDGVERFEYSAGLYAVERWQEQDQIVREASEALSVGAKELAASAQRFFEEWKQQRKLLDEVQKQLAELKAQVAGDSAESVGGVRIIVQDDLQPGAIKNTAIELIGAEPSVALLAAPMGDKAMLLFACSPGVELNMGNHLRSALALMGGKGGGKPDFAQGAGPDLAKLGEALALAVDEVKAALS